MSDRIDETKKIKINIDDETVEQLVENRYFPKKDTHYKKRGHPKGCPLFAPAGGGFLRGRVAKAENSCYNIFIIR